MIYMLQKLCFHDNVKNNIHDSVKYTDSCKLRARDDLQFLLLQTIHSNVREERPRAPLSSAL